MKYYLPLLAAGVLAFSQGHGSLFDGSGSEVIEDGNGNQWAFNADVLWWRAYEDGLNVATILDTTVTDTGDSDDARVINPHFQWDVGYRFGLDYRPCGCSWDIFVSWTHLDSKAKRHLEPGSATETIVPAWGSFSPFLDDVATLDSHWNLHLNWVDLELNRTFCVDPCFELGVHGGLRGAWVNQKFSLSITDTGTTPVTSDTIHSKSRYNSIGVVAGLDASWLVGCGFSVNASAGGALLYGRQKSHMSEQYVTIDGTLATTGSDHYFASRAMTDLKLGIGWEGCVYDCMTLALAVDWEHHILFDQNQLPRGSRTSAERPRSGDISTQGATFSATLFF